MLGKIRMVKRIEIYEKKRGVRIRTFLADSMKVVYPRVYFYKDGEEVAFYHTSQGYHKICDFKVFAGM